ncbi:3-methylmercaptopropionyl-CoA ligase (DmdB) [Roseibacterium elongatum DSM 19469]|uniref:3-methylmercaptopropionyl-CoA ligase n=1 Tax=Roseicyclus elongatus DSM 19469 TaxID=1294273 RepID=W8RWZ6_9RHOB|nr:AMP-binding protein [Roseibacterium elongatum]AHM05873.1 3-methylmercaptopropionyl-CoA ligase (DmdB) [Roseibacterium elongatum DSM 19469]
MGWMKDETGLEKRAANFVPLTPLSHLQRAAQIYPNRTAVVDRAFRTTYAEHTGRVTRLASALARRGVHPGDVVAAIMPNTYPHVEAHFGVPACGAILNSINIRLDVGTISYILDHGEAKVVLCDTQFLGTVEAALKEMEAENLPLIVEVPDEAAGYHASGRHVTYEQLLAEGDPEFEWILPQDEWESIALNYTSGTTGRPKGVVYHHRGAYLISMGTPISWRMTLYPHYLTIVPLFHCNNWCHVWTMPLVGGTTVCCREITAKNIYDAIADEGVTHFGGAPIVLNMIVNAKPEEKRAFDHTVEVFTAGAPPAAATLAAIETMGFNITQVYGLTETYGPATECTFKDGVWDVLEGADRATVKARQGVAMPQMDHITVMDPKHMEQVPMDGAALGEIMMRGNAVMKGYYKNPRATNEAFRGGYFHTGDIAMQHPDSYVQIADRAKDIIISGGENVSSVEVEGALMHHPAVLLSAVVAKPDEKWGEVPCAFVELKDSAEASEQELIEFVRQRLAGFKTPKHVVFRDLPKTSTGKVQKFELRKAAATL